MSKAPKILNIDDFVTPERVLRFKGVDHEVKEVSVQNFIDSLKAAEELENSGKKEQTPQRVSAQVELAVKNIMEAVPTFPEDELRKMKVPAMTAIMRFIRGDVDQEVMAGAAPAIDGTQDGKKKD